MPDAWGALVAELDRWTEDGGATLWWRDDDAYAGTDVVSRLLASAARHRVPVALAVIPRAAEPSLAHTVAGAGAEVTVLQHGVEHRNRAVAPARKSEFPDGGSVEEAVGAIVCARDRLQATLGRLYDRAWAPVFVPPWNRIDPALAAALTAREFRAVSAFGPRRSGSGGRPARWMNTHVDVIDWRGSRGFVGAERALTALVAHLAGRREGAFEGGEVTGVLTHHEVHDDGTWAFLDDLLRLVNEHPAARWLAVAEALG